MVTLLLSCKNACVIRHVWQVHLRVDVPGCLIGLSTLFYFAIPMFPTNYFSAIIPIDFTWFICKWILFFYSSGQQKS